MQLLKNLNSVIYSILFIPLLSSCVANMGTDRWFKKFDKNQNQAFEQTEFQPILKFKYKFDKQNHLLINKNISRKDYLKSEFSSHDDNNDGHVTLKEIQNYFYKKWFVVHDEDKNGYLDLDKEIIFLTEKHAYTVVKRLKFDFVKDGKRVISYEEYLIKVKEGLNPNRDKRVNLEEYQNFMPIYCGY